MKVIQLTKGQHATIDDEDYFKVCGKTWFAQSHNHGYRAMTNIRNKDGTVNIVYMHRLIMHDELNKYPSSYKMQIDHINHNQLDNRRKNLRVVTQSVNQRNMLNKQRGISRFKGVFQLTIKDKYGTYKYWYASIMIDSERSFLGNYENELACAWAYNQVAEKNGFLCLNDLRNG